MITAHSGCENTSRDSMESIYAALRYGPEAVETDVRMSDNGELRISHDAVSAADYQSKPTLEQVFTLLADTRMSLNCDIKNTPALYSVLNMADRFGFHADRLILSGCLSPEQLVRDLSILQKATVYLNIEEIFKFFYLSDHKVASTSEFVGLMNTPWAFLRKIQISHEWFARSARLARDLKIAAVNLPYRYLKDETAALFSAANVPVSVWTVNDPDLIDYCLEKNVLNITTLNVADACERRKNTFGC